MAKKQKLRKSKIFRGNGLDAWKTGIISDTNNFNPHMVLEKIKSKCSSLKNEYIIVKKLHILISNKTYLNHTIVELRLCLIRSLIAISNSFESYHSGIETPMIDICVIFLGLFESYHSGIETLMQ